MVAVTEEVAKHALVKVLGNKVSEIDEAIVDYLASTITHVAEEGLDALCDSLRPLLVDTGCADDEAASDAICHRLEGELKSKGALAEGGGESTQRMFAPVTIATNMKTLVPVGKAEEDLTPEAEEDEATLRARERQIQKQNARLAERKRGLQAQLMKDSLAVRPKGPPPQKLHPTSDTKDKNRDIRLDRVSVLMNGKTLLEETSLSLPYGRRFGLIGRNGIGKTTFLRALSTREVEGLPQNLQLLHVEQEVEASEMTVLEAVLFTDVERKQLLEEEARLHAMEHDHPAPSAEGGGAPAAATAASVGISDRLQQIYKRLEEIDAHTAEAKAAAILAGLGFSSDQLSAPTKAFSGGWRMRIALAQALFVEPDILMLDEPTNHLDLEAVMWLENFLVNQWTGTVIVVSHARMFLNTVVTDILHFFNKKLEYYKGDYDTFEQTRAERLKHQKRAIEAQDARRAHIQKFVDRFRFNAKRAPLVQSRLKALAKMEVLEDIVEDPLIMFKFPEPEPVAPPIIQVNDLSFWFNKDHVLFRNLNFGMDMQSRIAIVGRNGSGKTTLLRTILGDYIPTDGHVTVNQKIRIAYFTQHFVDQLELHLTPLEHMLEKFPLVPPQDIRAFLGRFGVTGDLSLQPIYTLSGGQKSRVAMAQLMFRNPHMLFLDEPTNHLDIDAVAALIFALNQFAGGVVLVSHDEHLITSV